MSERGPKKPADAGKGAKPGKAKKPRVRVRPSRKSTLKKKPRLRVTADGLPVWWAPYFAAIAANGGFKGRAAAACKIDRQAPLRYVQDHPELEERFSQAMQDAMGQAAEVYLVEIARRGFKGVLEPVFYQGRKTSSKRVYSDTLAMFRVNAMGYGTRQTTTTLDVGRLFTDEVMDAMTADQLRRLSSGEDPLVLLAELVKGRRQAKEPEPYDGAED